MSTKARSAEKHNRNLLVPLSVRLRDTERYLRMLACGEIRRTARAMDKAAEMVAQNAREAAKAEREAGVG